MSAPRPTVPETTVQTPRAGRWTSRAAAAWWCLLFSFATASLVAARVHAQEASPDTASAAYQKPPSRFYYGGSLGFSLSGDVLLVTVQPMVGYKLSPKASLGTRLSTQYVSDRRRPSFTAFNYGGSLFSRYLVTRFAFAQVEFELQSLELAETRETVPFLLLGGGYVRPLAPKTSLVVEILYDVIQDDRAFYHRDRGPRINIGIGVGL